MIQFGTCMDMCMHGDVVHLEKKAISQLTVCNACRGHKNHKALIISGGHDTRPSLVSIWRAQDH